MFGLSMLRGLSGGTGFVGVKTYTPAIGVQFSTYTFTNVPLGSARRSTKVITVLFDCGNTPVTLSSATIGGKAATVAFTMNTGSFQQSATIYVTGLNSSAGNVVLNWSGNLGNTANYKAVVYLGVYSSDKVNIELNNVSQVGSTSGTPSVAINTNARSNAFGIVGGIISDGVNRNLAANADLTSNDNQTISDGTNTVRFLTYSGFKSTAFTNAALSAATTFASLRSVTLY